MKTILSTLIIFLISLPIEAYECIKGTGTDSSIYVGEFKDCLIHGKGKMTWRDGTVFEGHFERGLRKWGKIIL